MPVAAQQNRTLGLVSCPCKTGQRGWEALTRIWGLWALDPSSVGFPKHRCVTQQPSPKIPQAGGWRENIGGKELPVTGPGVYKMRNGVDTLGFRVPSEKKDGRCAGKAFWAFVTIQRMERL